MSNSYTYNWLEGVHWSSASKNLLIFIVKTSCSESPWVGVSNDLVHPGQKCETYLSFYLFPTADRHICMCAHKYTHTHSFLQTPWVKHFRIPSAKPLWDSRMTTTGDGTSDSVSSDEPFDRQQSFQNGMKVLGNWELVLWAIRYLADGKINPHLLLVKKKRYIFPLQRKWKD